MRLTTLIVDDEAAARARLNKLLSGFPEVEVVGEARNGPEAIRLIDDKRPDLVLLDIQMPMINGFEVLKGIQHEPAVIFVTAYDEYALRAFEVHAVDYLLKPYTRDRLKEAIQRVTHSGENDENRVKRIESLLETYNQRESFLDRISVKTKYSYRVLEVEQIDFFRVENGLVFLIYSFNINLVH